MFTNICLLYLAIIVLAAVFFLIAVRQVGRFRLKIWQIMLSGAVAVLATGQISPSDAFFAINSGVMVFLFGMFIVGEAIVESGYLARLSHGFFSRAKTPDQLVLGMLFLMGLLSALVMNDTLAIIGTPLVIGLASSHRISPKILLLTLAMAITTGSVMSPIGNPQNLLVAVNSGMASPFVTFGRYLLVPTLICLVIPWLILRVFYPGDFVALPASSPSPVPYDARMVLLVRLSLLIIVGMVAVNILFSLRGGSILVSLPLIAIAAAAPILLFSPARMEIVRKIDWPTLVFFAAMFVLMESVWQTGFFQAFVSGSRVSSVPLILGTSILISQFISNVPFVALSQPVILQAGGSTALQLALAAGSTIAGNLTILGAASNVIIVQNAEKQGESLSFMEFLKIGVPVTLLQLAVFALLIPGG